MASSRYASFHSHSSHQYHPSSPSPSPSSNDNNSNTSRAVVVRPSSAHLINNNNNNHHKLLAAPKNPQGPTFGTMVKKFIERRSNLKPASAERRLPLPVPVADDSGSASAKGKKIKASNLTALHRKLFQKPKSLPSADRPPAKAALTEVKANTRTLAMVLRSERELLSQNKEHEDEIQELRLLLQDKDREVEKLKDLCLRQREEIKALKDAILFPDVMNSQLHELLEKQGSELKQARRMIPTLQKQVSSLTGQLQCLAEDLAEVKADKHVGRTCFEGHISTPQTPRSDQGAQNSLEYSSGCPMSYGSPDEMFLKDLNPCLTPCFSKNKSKEYDQSLDYDSPCEDGSLEKSAESSPDTFSLSRGGILSKSSEQCQQRPSHGSTNTARKMYKSDESRWSIGKPKHPNLF